MEIHRKLEFTAGPMAAEYAQDYVCTTRESAMTVLYPEKG